MAGQVVDLDALVINPAFAVVAAARPIRQGVREADWNIENFGRVQKWEVGRLENDQILAVGAEWSAQLMGGDISTRTAINGLKLALSLQTMSPGNAEYLLTEQARPEIVTDALAARTMLPAMDAFSNTAFALRNQQIVHKPIRNHPPLPKVPAREDSQVQMRTSYCFIAAYLMKIIVKSPGNVFFGLPNMKVRYGSFYGSSRTVARFNLTMQQAIAYKDAINSQILIGMTFTHAVANTQQNFSHILNPQETEALSYLCYMPLSYTGMHAYSLLLEIFEKVDMPFDRFLSLFYCDVTAPALSKVVDLVNTYERTVEHPDRDLTFRYCTNWAPHYFSSIRSKHSAHLLYTVACAWRELFRGDNNKNPENIASLVRISDGMKGTLRRAGIIIGNTLKGRKLKCRIKDEIEEEDVIEEKDVEDI